MIQNRLVATAMSSGELRLWSIKGELMADYGRKIGKQIEYKY
jgi:hypothetical protein